MALPGVYSEREIGIVMIGADPRAVNSNLRGDASCDAVYGPDILDYINQRLARFGLPDGVLGVVVLYIEVHVFRTTGRLRSGDGRRILGKGGQCEKEQSESDAHNSSELKLR